MTNNKQKDWKSRVSKTTWGGHEYFEIDGEDMSKDNLFAFIETLLKEKEREVVEQIFDTLDNLAFPTRPEKIRIGYSKVKSEYLKESKLTK